MNKMNTTAMSTIYWSLLAMLMTVACLIAVDIISPQNIIIIAVAVISLIGAIAFDMHKRVKARVAA